MGSDITLITSAYENKALTREQTDQEIYLFERSSAVGLLPLLCFRYYDLKIMIDEQESRDNLCPWIRYVIPFDLAIKQMNVGVEVLKNFFPGAVMLDRYINYYIKHLTNNKNNYLHMNCFQFVHEMEFDLLMHHCLMGIQYPTMKMYYSSDQIEQWKNWEKPAANGIMNWSGALRRLTRLGCYLSSDYDIDQEELFTPLDLQSEADMCIMGFSPGSPV
jgi:hypothetical protein